MLTNQPYCKVLPICSISVLFLAVKSEHIVKYGVSVPYFQPCAI